MSKELEVTFTVTHKGEEYTETITLTDGDGETEARQAIAEQLEESINLGMDEEDRYPITPADFTLDSCDCSETKDYNALPEIFQFAEAYCQNDQDGDIVDAALYCGVSPSDIDEAYAGTFRSDSDFAQDMHEQTRSHEAKELENTWPFNCIDWKYAAKELMYDYSSHNNHYFRNM